MPNALVNPNNASIQVQPSTCAFIYEAVDCTNDKYFIKGSLNGDVLEFTVITKIAGEPRANVSGSDFFAAMIAHFTLAAIRGIKGHWIAGLDLETNIDAFNSLTQQGVPDTEAAKRTWTGKLATAYGFVNVTIDWKNPPGDHPGRYNEVQVTFRR